MTRALQAALAAAAAFVCASPLVDPDLWWHLEAGRGILAGGGPPRLESWSWTLSGAPWVDFEWLAQAGLAAAYRAGGFEGLVALKALACAGAAWLVFRLVAQEDGDPWAALLGALLALSAVRLRAHARPELATLLLLPLFLSAALRRRRGPCALWPLAPLTALWANLHAGWPLGPAVLALAAVGRAWEARSPRDDAARDLALWGAACAAASFLTPYGLDTHRVIVAHALRPPAAAGIEEWMTEGLRFFPAFWLLLAAAAARVLADLRLGRRGGLFWLVVLAPLAALGLSGARFAPLFCLAAPACVLGRTALVDAPRTMRPGLVLACLALAAALAAPALHRKPGRPVRWETVPREALAYLDREGVGGKLFNDYPFGGYIAWASEGRRKVYMDGRYLFQDLLARADPSGADYAVLRRRPLLSRTDWALVWFDDAAVVYLRRTPANAALIARDEFKAADPADPDAMLARIRAGEVTKAAVLEELSRRPCAVAAALSGLVSKS